MATVAQRVNEMEFALRGMGVTSAVRDHLDLKAHADPTLTAKENIDEFLEEHGLERSRSLSQLKSMEEQAREEGLDSEVQRRLDEREAQLVAEIRAEGCEECNAKLRALEARLKKTPGGQALKKKRRAYRVVAKTRKANPKAARAMRLASKRGISLKSAWGIVKRGGGKPRRTARKAARAARRSARRAAPKKSYSHRAKSLGAKLTNMTLGTGIETAVGIGVALDVIDKAKENIAFYKDNQLGWAGSALGIVAPKNGTPFIDWNATAKTVVLAGDGAAAVGAIHAARTSGLTDPLLKRAFNMRLLKGDLNGILKRPVREYLRAAPSASGWLLGAVRYKSHKAIYAGSSYNPRTAAITGVQIQPTGTGIRLAATKNTILDSAMVPVAAGGVGSKIAGAALASPLVKPIRPLLALHA